MTDRPWPAVVERLVACSEEPSVARGPDRWSVGPLTVRRFPDDRSRQATVALLDRLAGSAPFAVPTIVGEAGRWLVTARPDGHPADRPELHADPDELVTAVGAGLKALHDLPLSALRADDGARPPEGWPAVAERCRAAVADGLVDSAALPGPYDRYRPDELLAMLIGGRPSAEDLVCCHGSPSAGMLLVAGGRFVGFDGIESALVADRHLDLAVAHQSVQHHLGPEAVFRLYDAYGGDPDVIRLDHYVLASHLLGLGVHRDEAGEAMPR